jgi:outer membrane protein
MKIIYKTILVSLILSTGVVAETFTEALQKAFKNNSELNAERENLNVSEEDLKVSRSNYLPSVTLSGSKSQVDTNKLTNQSGGNAAISDTDPTTKSLTITQTLVDFGRGADYEKKTIGIDVAKAKLLKKEQDILYSTVEAYTGLILANEKLNINRANVNLLERQVETDQIKLERGQNTLSDVAQSESSLAGARAKLIQAENDFLTSKLNYENIIGPLSDPKTLEKKSIFDVNLPADLNSAINKSKLTNPDLIIAQLEYEQSTKDTYEAKSDLAPSATLSLDRTYTDDLSSTYDERERDTIKATVSWPFYSGGKNFATIRKSKSLETQKKLLLEDMIKRNETLVASAWSSYQSNKSLLNSVQSQVRAAEIANEGIVAEYNSGSGRTTLDVIQSNALLLNAQISLADSERNYILSQFNLLKSIGLLDSNYLNIN